MNGLTIWTAIMALAIIATAIFAGGTLWKSNKRQRLQLANLLFNEFTNRDLNIWELFSVICGERFENEYQMEVKISPLNFNKLKQNDLDFFIFLAKLGLSLRKK